VWAKLDALWMPAISTVGHTNEQAVANLNLVSSNYTLAPNGSPTFTADRGYTGGADHNTTVWLDTGFNPATGSPHFVSGEAHISGVVAHQFPVERKWQGDGRGERRSYTGHISRAERQYWLSRLCRYL
jgi:hypothetical protein